VQRSFPDRRATLVDQARREGMTWREIAHILDMTEHGLIKADKAWKERGKPQG
jgi:transposase